MREIFPLKPLFTHRSETFHSNSSNSCSNGSAFDTPISIYKASLSCCLLDEIFLLQKKIVHNFPLRANFKSHSAVAKENFAGFGAFSDPDIMFPQSETTRYCTRFFCLYFLLSRDPRPHSSHLTRSTTQIAVWGV